jgi:hypothetical protein
VQNDRRGLDLTNHPRAARGTLACNGVRREGLNLGGLVYRRDAVALTVELLKQLVASLSPSEDTKAALNFLNQSDLTQIVPAEERLSYSPAEYWLRIYKIRQGSTTRAGIATYGFPSLLAALEKLHSELLTITAFATKEWYAVFWSDQADQLVGFVLVKRRTPEQEQERFDWFRRHMT